MKAIFVGLIHRALHAMLHYEAMGGEQVLVALQSGYRNSRGWTRANDTGARSR